MRVLVSASRVRGPLLALLVLVSGAGAAFAQTCQAELTAALPEAQLERVPTGLDAAAALRRAVELVEPALPPLQYDKPVPLEANDPQYQTVKYLVERKLLPDSWGPGELDGETWAVMLDRFLRWYKLPPSGVDAPADVADMLADVEDVLGRVSHAIRPAALLATDQHDSSRTSFWAIIWNWTVYPRLLVVRPDEAAGARPADVLAALSNCAVHITAFISAPEETAKALFLTHNDSRMYVVASQPTKNGFWPYEVAAGEELDAFAFGLPDLSGVRLYAAVFDGPEVGFGTLLSLFWRVRTNVAPTALMGYLATPN
ncbi:MAG: hypothetical protein WC972_06925 [Trueperaceae bacterium]